MEAGTPPQRKAEHWSSPVSPLSLSPCDSSVVPGALRLDIGEFEGEPFSTKFVDLFGGLGLHVSEEDPQHQVTGTPDNSYDHESFSNIRDMAFGRQYPGIEELVILSAKRPRSNALPTIHEDHQESRCSNVPTASLSDFEFEFDAFDHPSAKGTTVCTRRDNQTMYTIKRKRAARNSSWSEQRILETLTIQEQPFVPRLRWSFYSGEHLYIVSDLYTGSNMEDLVRQRGPLSIYHATFYAAELACAVSGLHDAGIMHRSIEPRNIQLDKQGHIILTHFESAGFVTSEGTYRTGVTAGFDFASSVYCAPEIILGWTHDLSVDCWSFGMFLYYMAFGTTPYTNPDGIQDSLALLYDQVVRTTISPESLRLVHPMARDLVLNCLERNPELRWGINKIKAHPYFASIDWEKVSLLQTEVPLFDKPLVSLEAHSTKVDSGHRRHSSLSLSLINYDRPASLKGSPPAHRRSHSFQRPSAPEPTGDDTPMSPLGLFRTLGRAMSVLHEDEGTPASLPPPEAASRYAMSITCERRMFSKNDGCGKSDFWEGLDKEEATSVNSLEFGTATGAPYSKAPKLRKYRSAIQSRSRLFSVSTSSFQTKMRKKPRSTGALRQPKPVEVIENLPLGIHQIGSGIGFKYTVVPAVPSKVSVGSFTPSCHLFQRSFSGVRNLGFALGNSSAIKVKAKPLSPVSPPTLAQAGSSSTQELAPRPQRREVGHGTFIREMSRSPSWILSPTDCLPSPMALVNVDSPASVASGSELLSPITLVNAAGEEPEDSEGGDEDCCHVNITIPKNLEVELGFPLACWAPDSTLRLVPRTASTIRLPYMGSVDSSLCADHSWA